MLVPRSATVTSIRVSPFTSAQSSGAAASMSVHRITIHGVTSAGTSAPSKNIALP
ncbi:hypothetical protein [Nannocystis pusilla]|uniref:hypothetical protein n=1 Tax=Nannocystis pusilla TaxID=889268 RepID=UPI003BF3157A